MKVGILTQPLSNNYGGLLQAYALQTVLKNLGHEPWIIRRVNSERSIFWEIKFKIKKSIYKNLVGINGIPATLNRISPEEIKIISQHNAQFIEKYINPKTNLIDSNRKLKKIAKQGFDALIIGSDQVWRLDYSPNMLNYFLDFSESLNVKRIVYAASFGTDIWHFPEVITKKCKRLAQQFDAISVREDSAVKLCRNYLGVNAEHLIDPTFLLSKETYEVLIDQEKGQSNPGNLFCYFLDSTNKKMDFTHSIAEKFDLSIVNIMPPKMLSSEQASNINQFIYPSVTKWLKSFSESKFIITDSFHGCAFALIFNIPFIVIDNPKRGSCRIHSLLRIFNLSDRLCSMQEDIAFILKLKELDWNTINSKILEERRKSLIFLGSNL